MESSSASGESVSRDLQGLSAPTSQLDHPPAQLDRARMHTVVWGSFIVSRLLVLCTGIASAIYVGRPAGVAAGYTEGLKAPGGYFGSQFFSSVAAWDAHWYVEVSRVGYGVKGYDPQSMRTAFFPLYPTLIHVLSWIVGSPLMAGFLISMVCFPVGLLILYKLVCLDFSENVAAATVMLLAFFPMAVFFSAIYTESLFLMLSVATIYQARRGQWVWAGALGFLAALTRNSGVLLVVPVLIMLLYGPRQNPDSVPLAPTADSRHGWRIVLPRYVAEPRGLAILAIPCGLVIYLGYLQARYGMGAQPFKVEAMWYHKSTNPISGYWQALKSGFDGLRQILHGPGPPYYVQDRIQGVALPGGLFNLVMLLMVTPLILGLVGVFRRQHFAYFAYALLGMLMPLSDPVTAQPLQSVPRYLMVLFPLMIWAAERLERRGWTPFVLAGSGMMLGVSTVFFSTFRLIG